MSTRGKNIASLQWHYENNVDNTIGFIHWSYGNWWQWHCLTPASIKDCYKCITYHYNYMAKPLLSFVYLMRNTDNTIALFRWCVEHRWQWHCRTPAVWWGLPTYVNITEPVTKPDITTEIQSVWATVALPNLVSTRETVTTEIR